MSHLTHIQKLKLQTHDGIVLLRGETELGAPIYAYVKVDAHDIDEIETAYKKGQFIDYSKYKGILKCDWGIEPPDNVKKYMEKTYNFVHEKSAEEE